MPTPSFAGSLVAATALLANVAHADLGACARILADPQRLACYDALAQPAAATAPAAPRAADAPTATRSTATPASEATRFTELWELDPDTKRGTFRLLPHRPTYALLHATNRVNTDPRSPTRADAASPIELQHVDAKLQLSFKTKLAEDLLGSPTDLWFGYTQQSYWQAINSRYSSPFRESNYEPEAILVHPLRFALGPVHASYAALSLNHQSNGQGGALSRSWNRVIGDLGMTAGPFSMQVRPWVRLDASADSHDDNPDIEDYVGRGEIVAAYRAGRHVFTLRGRHSLRSGDRSHGSAQLDWAYRLAGALNAHVQVFSGYGESLIDYNLRQTTVGVGVSFFD